MDVMDHLAADLTCALDDAKGKKSRGWKHRRSRSTSNLTGAAGAAGPSGAQKTDSGSESSDDNKSELAERSFARLSLQNKTYTKYLNQKFPSVAESDSLNEVFAGPSQQLNSAHSKRRRRHKRMAVETSDIMESDCHDGDRACTSVAAVIPRSKGLHGRSKKKSGGTDAQVSVDVGKRKRHKDRITDGSTGDLATESIPAAVDMNNDNDEDMKSDDCDDETSSVFSSSDSESFQVTCDEGQEGDDEHSDWVGDEWMNDDGGDSAERRRDLIMRKLRDHAPFREIRAGRRRVHPNKPVFSFRTSANEQLSKFLMDPEQSELKLHPMRKSERQQLSQIASLYSLQMHCRIENEGLPKGFTCPVLTKTSNTAQMDLKPMDDESAKTSWLEPLWLESDSKRIKK